MERAFRPKAPKEGVNDRAEGAVESPLKSVEQDRAEVNGFKFVFGKASTGILEERVINALANPNLKIDEGNGIYRLNGYAIKYGPREEVLTTRVTGGGVLTKENARILARLSVDATRENLKKSSSDNETVGFQSVFNKAVTGDFDEKVINALANPNITTEGDNGIYRLNGYAIKYGPREEVLTTRVTGGGVITKEQSLLLREIAKSKALLEGGKANAESQIAGINFVTKGILSGDLDERVVNAFTNPNLTIDESSGIYRLNGYAIKFGLRQEILTKRVTEGGTLSSAQGTIIKRITKILDNPKVPDEVKTSIRGALTQNSGMVERMEAVMAMSSSEELRTEVVSLLKELDAEKRSANLRKEIYGGLAEGRKPEELAPLLATFEQGNLEGLEVVGELQDVLRAKRRENIVREAVKSLPPQSRNIEAVLASAGELLRSGDDKDRQAGAVLVNTAYKAELADFSKGAQDLVKLDATEDDLRLYLDTIPLRPSFGEFDYVNAVNEIRERVSQDIQDIQNFRRIERATVLRESFATGSPDTILAEIDNFPGETAEDQAIRRELFTLYRSYVAGNRPEIFDERFAGEIREREIQGLKERFACPELGRNKRAFNYMRERFIETVFPLVESLRADGTTADDVASVLDRPTKMNGEVVSPRRKFEQRVSAFEEQRPLTDTERAYLESVELLSVFNPYLIAAITADPGTTNEFLRHHFDTLSENTLANLRDGDYIPLLQIGTGPNGIAAFGELVRNNPALAENALVVDAGEQPGGPFAIPKGAAWELNSANKRGNGAPTLPDQPNGDEIKTVRAYGSPLRWYPGERKDNGDIRQGSINTTVDYLPTPDDLSSARYPTNEELQSVLSLQTAMLVKNLALETRVVSVDPNPNEEDAGDKIVTLQVGGKEGYQLKIKTDAIFASTGLGEPGFGFKLEGSKAEQIIRDTKDSEGFPKISQTLEAFEALANRSGEDLSPGETLVIYGKGNSADTLIEYIGSVFQGDNPRVRDVTKIYVIAEGELSARPRYAQINDLRPRNGRGNLIEQIPGRVADVGYATLESAPEDRQLVVLDTAGQPIRDREGKPILANSVIAATGFRSELDTILDAYAMKKAETAPTLRTPLNLPTNKAVPVADTLSTDPNVLILGTASRPQFDQLAKLSQLPKEPRDALLRNGAENAVAIGFRAPDTQAAVNIWLNSKEVLLPEGEMTARREVPLTVGLGEGIKEGETKWLTRTVNPENIAIPNNITNEIRLLSPLLAYEVGNKIEVFGRNGRPFTGELSFELTSNPDQMLGITLTGGQEEVSGEAYQTIKSACENKDFQKYAFVALQKKRRNQKLEMVIGFKNGKVDPRNTFVQS
ncbi:MAG: hypothetical protein KBC16_00540 [Candidatus Pacebacteria bacterium]|nr:hypothetical protein [Candidatus Paceibacterota bacterium]